MDIRKWTQLFKRAIYYSSTRLLQFLLVSLYLLSYLFPRSDSIWVLGAAGGQRFGENSKYVFLYLHNNEINSRPIWVSRDVETVETLQSAGYEAYPIRSLRGTYYTSRAKHILVSHRIDDIGWPWAGGAVITQLWHGNPLKDITYDHWHLPDRILFRYFKGNFDHLVVTSSRSPADIFSQVFNINKKDLLVTGYPRSDSLYDHVKGSLTGVNEDRYNQIVNLAEDSTVLFYLPTWRRWNTNQPFTDISNIEQLNELLESYDAYLIVKFHMHTETDINFSDFSRILLLDNYFDIYTILRYVDGLITDYSSVYFDFLLLDKPIVFFPFDFEEYRTERGFHYEYEEVTPGPQARDFQSLLEKLENVLRGVDKFSTERDIVRKEFFDYEDGNSTDRLVDALKNN